MGPTEGDDAGAASAAAATAAASASASTSAPDVDVDVEWQAIICLVQRPTTCFCAVSAAVSAAS